MTCGIYRIYHKGTGKSYIGQSHNVEGRIRDHFKCLRNNTHVNTHLQRAFNLQGESSFETQIVEVCQSSELTEKEQFWIDTALYYAGVYNLVLIAGPGRKGYKSTLETRQKLSEIRKGKVRSEETRQKIRESNLGQKRSDEFCAKMREVTKGNSRRLGSTHSEETRLKLSKALRGKKLSIEHRRKLSEASSKRTLSEEHKAALSKANTGRKHSEESRRKMSETKKRRYHEKCIARDTATA